MTDKLTIKQQLFVDNYLIDFNATQAAIRAGYSKKTAKSIATENLSKPAISAAIQKSMVKRCEKVQVDANWVLAKSAELAQRCMQEVRPKMIKVGKEYIHEQDEEGNKLYVFNAAGAAKALDLVGKHVDVQAFKENSKTELTAVVGVANMGEDKALQAIKDLKGNTE